MRNCTGPCNSALATAGMEGYSIFFIGIRPYDSNGLTPLDCAKQGHSMDCEAYKVTVSQLRISCAHGTIYGDVRELWFGDGHVLKSNSSRLPIICGSS